MLRASRRTVYYRIAKGKFPNADVELGTQLRAWRYETVARRVDSRTITVHVGTVSGSSVRS